MHEIYAYTQMPLIYVHAGTSTKARVINSGLSLHLHPYIVYVSSKGSGESALCWDKYQNLAYIMQNKR